LLKYFTTAAEYVFGRKILKELVLNTEVNKQLPHAACGSYVSVPISPI